MTATWLHRANIRYSRRVGFAGSTGDQGLKLDVAVLMLATRSEGVLKVAMVSYAEHPRHSLHGNVVAQGFVGREIDLTDSSCPAQRGEFRASANLANGRAGWRIYFMVTSIKIDYPDAHLYRCRGGVV